MPGKRSSDKSRSQLHSRSKNGARARNGAQPSSNGRVDSHLVRLLLEGLQEGVANVSSDGRILYANSRFAELLSLDPARHLVGAKLKDFVSSASWLDLDSALARGIQKPTEGEMNVVTPSGSARTIRLSLTPVRVGDNTTIKVAAREVTELVEKNRVLQDTEASLHSLSARILQLQDQERRRIARDLHDITGQELAVVVMSLNQLVKKIDEPGVNVREALVDAVGLVRKIEDEIRTLSYVLHPPLLDDFGLVSALNWYVEGFAKRSGIQVEVKTSPDLPRLSVEKETALFRVVQESLTNVLRHSGSHAARIRIAVDADGVELAVTDEGHGIDREKLGKVNRPSTDSGVGIAGMRERLQQLGGNLRIRPSARGTEVIATLPVLEGENATSAAEAAVSQAMAVSPPAHTASSEAHQPCKKRVLIVDDHEVTRHGIKMLLKDESDIEICSEAEDGFQAVIEAKKLAPDLVIMDLSLPRVSGYSAATSIRQSGLPTKILFFTTHSYPQLERMSRVAGFEGFVQKTNGARDLVRGVRAVLAGNKFYNSEVVQENAASPASSPK